MPDHSTTSHPSDPSSDANNPYASARVGDGPASARFFGWMRGLGIVRQNGWVGGVCGGIAARIGIDPIIVRGIAVVIAVLGGPAFLLYAAAWALLPDAQGEIHLERLFKGHFDPPIIAILVIALFSFLPFAQGFWWAGAQFWGGLSWFASVGRVMWTLVVIALIVGVVIWAARSGRTAPTAPAPSPTSPTDAAGGAAHPASAPAAPASTTVPSPDTDATPPAPGAASGTAGTSGAAGDAATAGAGTAAAGAAAAGATPAGSDDAYADWRTRQEAWKTDYAAWSAREADARAMRQQRSAEMRAQAQALAAEADAARRARRAANPRTSAAYVGIALGVALVAGGVAGILAPGGLEVVVGLAIATLAVGLSIVLAGALRRRSGFLGFVSILLLLGMLAAAIVPRHHALAFGYASYTNERSLSLAQPFGSVALSYTDPGSYQADVVQGAGTVWVVVPSGSTVTLVLTQANETQPTFEQRYQSDTSDNAGGPPGGLVSDQGNTRTYVVGDGAQTALTVRVDQRYGDVDVQFDQP
jgi:phage shock protein PspC (stress-responsive transcriptional regulator)